MRVWIECNHSGVLYLHFSKPEWVDELKSWIGTHEPVEAHSVLALILDQSGVDRPEAGGVVPVDLDYEGVPRWLRAVACEHLIENFSGHKGVEAKTWLIDQILRVLTGRRYDFWVKKYNKDHEESWDVGEPPSE